MNLQRPYEIIEAATDHREARITHYDFNIASFAVFERRKNIFVAFYGNAID